MDLIKKLEDLSARYNVVSELVGDASLIKDQKKYKETMREHQQLTELMSLYDEYKKILKGIEDATVLITDRKSVVYG